MFHTLLIVTKLVEAQDAVESNVITAFGAERVGVPKVICPFWMNTWKVEVGIVPLSFVRYSCNLRHRFISSIPGFARSHANLTAETKAVHDSLCPNATPKAPYLPGEHSSLSFYLGREKYKQFQNMPKGTVAILLDNGHLLADIHN